MSQKSGIDSLLEALRASGVDVGSGAGSPFGGGQQGSGADSGSSSGASGGSSSRGAGASGQGGFGGFGGFGNFGGFGGGRHGGGSGQSFSNAMAEWGKKAIIVTAIVVVVLALAAYWWFHPPINIHSVDTWFFVAVFILLPLFVFFRVRSAAYKSGTKKVTPSESKAKGFRALSFIPVIVVLVGLIGGIMSYPIFPGNAGKYASVLQVEDSTFADDIQQVNYSEIPVIDHDSAVRLGNTQLGSIPDYVSQFEISNLYSQINYNQEPVRVSPLGYADLFKWFTNREAGLPAYALVNMTTQEAQIVTLPEGEGMKYSQSEPLARNIDRYVQLKYPFYMFDEKSFEIDDDGRPWWICPVQTRTIGLFGGTTIDRVVLVDAVTGECQDLAIGDCPQWVDRAYPSDLLIQQYNWHGAYAGGFLNSIFGQQGVVQTTPGTDGMQGYNYIAKDDDVWVYTGVTSATADNSIVGFVLVNQRTAEAHFYSVSGATEDRAMRSAEGAVQDLGYSATFPILINISDRPTYFMSLKDGEGTVKQFAMVDIQSYQNVATATTVEQCQKSYEALLATSGVMVDNAAAGATTESATGVIRTMVEAVVEGNSRFYVTLDGDDRIFDCALPSMLPIVSYAVGDEVTFEFTAGESTCTVTAVKGAGEASGEGPSDASGGTQDSAAADDAAASGGSSASGQASEGQEGAPVANEGAAAPQVSA